MCICVALHGNRKLMNLYHSLGLNRDFFSKYLSLEANFSITMSFVTFIQAVIMTMTVFPMKAVSHQQYFRVKPKDTEIVEGRSSDLQCHIGNQAGAVQWSKDGFVLGFDPDIPGYPRYSMIVDERRGVYNLKLRGVQLDDEGEYQCQVGPAAKNHPIRAESRVTILVPPRKLEILKFANGTTLEVREAERITLTCVAKHSKPAAKLKWYRNGVLLQGSNFHPREEMTGSRVHTTTSTITLYVIMDDNGASYTCEGIHKALAHPLRAKITIDVLYPPGIPEIEGYQEGDIVQVGDTLTLACITRGGNPAAELIWYRDNVQVDMSYSTSGREVTNIHTFTVDATDNNAIYRCEASNSVTYHPRIASVKLSVRFAPSKIIIHGPTEGKVGNIIDMTCSAGPSNPPSQLTWLVDGKTIEEITTDVTATRGGWLTTSNITVTLTRQDPDNKTFTCYADSEALNNSIKETITFSVVYPPSPPSIMGYEEGTPIRSGDFQRFTCVAIGGNPLATLRWFKRDREVRASTSVSGSGVFSELVIRADASDNGATYRCEATNSATEKMLVANIVLTVHFPPSSVTLKTTPARPRAGETITITCESGSSNPESTLHWWRNSEVIGDHTSDVTEALYGGKTTHSRLDFPCTSKDDEAIYTCQATNQILQRSVHESVAIRVLYRPEFLVPNLEKFDVIEGETLLINLTARGNPTLITYSWRKGLAHLGHDTSAVSVPSKNDIRHNSRVSSKGPLLEIKESKREDAGQYECEATNSEGSGSTVIIVNVLYPAVVTSVTRSTVVSQSEDAQFECAAIGNPMRSDVIKWKREGFDLLTRTVQRLEWGRSYLTVFNVSRSDAGVFECIANNDIGPETVGRAQLIVKFQPELYTPRKFRKVAADRGSTVRLKCLAVGAPMVTFSWSFQGQPLEEHQFKATQIDDITWESLLHVKRIEDVDYGRYTCRGKNDMGSDSLKVLLEKKGKPDPPENLQVQNVTTDRVVLSWIPGFDGGLTQHFRIRFQSAGSGKSILSNVIPSNISNFELFGLKSGTEYSFSVMAFNTLGESEYTTDNVSAHTLMSRLLPSTAVDALAKENEDVSMFFLVVISVAGTLLLVINGAIVACYLQRKKRKNEEKKRQHSQDYSAQDSKGPSFVSNMYSRDKYHDTINGEALRSPINEEDGAFHEEILMKEIMKQETDQEKISKVGLGNSNTKQQFRGKQIWTESTTESNCPDILKNGHNYGKDGCETTTLILDNKLQEIHRDSLLDERVPADVYYSASPLGASGDTPTTSIPQGATALGVAAVDLASGKTKTIVLHPTLHSIAQDPTTQQHISAALNCVTLDGHFL